MIRRGVEAFDRGKYQDARAYFRKAISSDPESEVA
jgi:Tfp pilus assembly protein PilF